ncbi:NADH-quinone oxidoreductase subunit NuoH [Gorillibacterium massiliense]|uniref:NADH-quinone oxidoreductase subunit NuoH n=1 Tax=Gorillibacterium massiliense TaxID=1280390 RepID=UPI0004AE9510|nr:NADH-quinone oxidoreductase subunit NuoH [Gorillibacterium massiliense]
MGDLLNQPISWWSFFVFVFFAVVLLVIILTYVVYAIFFERKVIAWMQFRIGPNRTGPWGLLQSVADVMKLLFKEDVVPRKAEKYLFLISPVIAFVPSFVIMAIIPFTDKLYFTNLNIGILYYVALSGISTIGFMLGGWSSNNKYALIGGMRSAAQMVSYEIPLVISVTGTVMMAGTLNMHGIVEYQAGGFWHWNFIPQIVGFVVFIIAGISELNRTPFDLPEAENELVAGYNVEYTGFRYAFFYLTEYVYTFAMACLTTVLFLGGHHAPFPALEGWHTGNVILDVIPGLFWFAVKFVFCVFCMFWVRASMPRVRVDQLMSFGWKVLLPLSLLNIFITAAIMQIF